MGGLHAANVERRRRARQAVRDFVEGAAAGNAERMTSAFNDLDGGPFAGGGWARAFRAVARLGSVPDATRAFFLRVQVESGDHIRQETLDDLALTDGLRVLLPPYTGPAMTLYRGEGAHNRSRRTYGLSWSASRDVADECAQGWVQASDGGSVLLQADVPSAAIICAPAVSSKDLYDEAEYLVDRRLLRAVKVKVIARYPQVSAAALRRGIAPP